MLLENYNWDDTEKKKKSIEKRGRWTLRTNNNRLFLFHKLWSRTWYSIETDFSKKTETLY